MRGVNHPYFGKLMRRIISLTILTLLLVISSVPAGAQSRSYIWDRWDVVIDDMDTTANEFTVTEMQTITFNGSFSFGFRNLPLERVNGYNVLSVSANGTPLSASCS